MKIGKIINKFLSVFGVALHTLLGKENYSEKQLILQTNSDKSDKKNNDFIKKNCWLKNRKIKTIIDIGANEGQFCEKFIALLPEAEFHCFEPLAKPFNKLKNKFGLRDKFYFYPFALGSKEGKKKIFRNEYSPSSSILPMLDEHKKAFSFAKQEFEEEVEIRTLDNLMKDINLNRPYAIKIDVQGYESEVIQGGVETIRNAGMIIIETSFVKLYEGAPLFDDIYNKLSKLGFAYSGSIEQLARPKDGKLLQQDAIFLKKKDGK